MLVINANIIQLWPTLNPRRLTLNPRRLVWIYIVFQWNRYYSFENDRDIMICKMYIHTMPLQDSSEKCGDRLLFRPNCFRTVQSTAFNEHKSITTEYSNYPPRFFSPPPRKNQFQLFWKISKSHIADIYKAGSTGNIPSWPASHALLYWEVWMTPLVNFLSYGRKMDPSVELNRFLSADRGFGKSQFF